jgi:hypothetical protein
MQECNADQRSAHPRASHAFSESSMACPVAGNQRLPWLMSWENPGQLPTGEKEV